MTAYRTVKEIRFRFAYSATIVKTPKGYTLRTMGSKIHTRDGDVVWLWNDTTDEQMMLSTLLAGGKFCEFDPVKIFGTAKPKGSAISAWLKSIWGTGEVYSAMAWVKASVPLDVLLGFGGPLPGVTADAETGWHWSCQMQCVRTPRYFESQKSFAKNIAKAGDDQ